MFFQKFMKPSLPGSFSFDLKHALMCHGLHGSSKMAWYGSRETPQNALVGLDVSLVGIPRDLN